MNIPIRFDLNINAQKLDAAIKAGLDPKDSEREAPWWQRIEHAQSGGKLMDVYEAPLRQSYLSVWVLGREYKLDENAIRRAIQILADRYPQALADILQGVGNKTSRAPDWFVQCALFGEVRYYEASRTKPTLPGAPKLDPKDLLILRLLIERGESYAFDLATASYGSLTRDTIDIRLSRMTGMMLISSRRENLATPPILLYSITAHGRSVFERTR